jgi:hypothetical protein
LAARKRRGIEACSGIYGKQKGDKPFNKLSGSGIPDTRGCYEKSARLVI